jgi:hypothetical protein
LKHSSMRALVCAFFLILASAAWGDDTIPKAAWKRPLGLPLSDPGVTRVAGNIDDGYWQGVPVGGFGAGTFSRSYRGDFTRWHIKAGTHKYETVYANQFAMFQQSEGDAHGVAQVLMNGHPAGKELSSWQWDYPVGAGDYDALYPPSSLITTANRVIQSLSIDGTRITRRIRPSLFPFSFPGRICRVGSGRLPETSTERRTRETITISEARRSGIWDDERRCLR